MTPQATSQMSQICSIKEWWDQQCSSQDASLVTCFGQVYWSSVMRLLAFRRTAVKAGLKDSKL